MADGSGRAALGWKVVAPVLAIGVLAVGIHLWLNTNLLGRDEVCGGLVSTDSAAAVIPSSGRVSDRDGLDARPGDRLAFTCTVESSSFLPGSDTAHMRISGSRERGDFAFTDDGRWPNPATASFFTGGATGAVGEDHGWVLLPGTCTTQNGPAIVEGYAPEGSDPVKLARLLTDVANKAAERAGCLDKGPLGAPTALTASPESRLVDDAAVCGLQGLTFPGPDGRTRAEETVQENTRPTWACEVAGYATYAVTQEPRIVEGIRSSPGFKEQPRVAGRQVSGFDSWHVVADCAGVPTYFSLEFGQSYQDAVGAPGTPRRQDLFDDFVEAAGKRLGCFTPTS
ncbi:MULTISPECIES: hypothetical protein [Streptomyces]|uniref:DUF3558 domain-containing protein n=1 Tax=Streptomyces venezuelae TaxID=54571 RepID=A0A5P2AZN6_STRVZ|nr:hypothetical protein [Streptomyces venezuelae]QES22351.1 hypothetical protein DEJ46_27310 [Streptomyces venezuelae]